MNPFPINNYISPEYFCDREAETKTLIDNVINQSNTAFFAQRRIGKTALIHHVLHLLTKRKINCIYIDIYATQNIKDFTNQLANSIYRVFPQNKGVGMKFWAAIKLLRPVVSIDEMTGNPELSLDITQNKQFERTIPQLLHFLDKQNTKTVIAIDEFQQILSYPEKNIEALLRTAIQQMKNVHFIFSGSNQKMMHHIFHSAKRPFYASAKSINLQKINRPTYAQFIRKMFRKKGFTAGDDEIELILDLTCGHTYYTQRLCHEIVVDGQKKISESVILRALDKIMREYESNFFQYRALITPAQWSLLRAFALEETIERPYAKDLIYNYKLGTSAHVKRGIEALIEKELVYYNASVKVPYYEVSDKFLMRWLQRY